MPTPRTIAGYTILERLGRGADGTVYLAESTDGLNKQVALKVFKQRAQKRFNRERAIHKRLEAIRRDTGSPHLAEVLAAGERQNGGGYLALAFQAGGTLADTLDRDGPRPPPRAAGGSPPRAHAGGYVPCR